jgi:protease-4
MADTTHDRAVRLGVALGVALVALVAGLAAFVAYPSSLQELLGVVAALAVALVGLRVGGRLARAVAAPYNVAEVSVEGPITRDRASSSALRPIPGASADDVVEQIERADEDGSVAALVVRLNTPGGAPVPSEDIRRAAAEFDGPTVAYATDVCASGGYLVAAGCDRIVARRGSVVGSIGVLGSTVNASDLAERVGLSYEQFVAGEYKDAGVPLKDLDADERTYLQGLVDDHYAQFVARVAEGRGLDPRAIRATEARVYLGEGAEPLGLVDDLGDRDTVEAYLAEELREGVEIREFEPARGLGGRLRRGAAAAAYAVGTGVADRIAGDRNAELDLSELVR